MLWDFDAREDSPDEISVKADQIVNLVQEYGYQEEDKDWYWIFFLSKSIYSLISHSFVSYIIIV